MLLELLILFGFICDDIMIEIFEIIYSDIKNMIV